MAERLNSSVQKPITRFGEKFDFDVDVHIEIKKSIPVAGGMAGGSADAAGTLVAMDSLFQLEMSREELHALGSELGSDVPFMISGGTAIGQRCEAGKRSGTAQGI